MAFVSLADRIENLPLVLCGPIVRRAEDRGVTVWLALRQAVESVQLSIFNDFNGTDAELVAFEGESTIRMGEYLHVIAITAKPMTEEEPLEWGKSYLYDIAFDPNKAGGFKSLKDEGVLKDINSIVYHEHNYSLPGFTLAPKKVSKLHFIQGSCRNAEGKGLDAMQALDDILLANWQPNKRPQQLFLTGDQIYADEVDDTMLFLIKDAAKVLLAGEENWEETLTYKITVIDDKDGKEKEVDKVMKASEELPGQRKKVVHEEAMFTTTTGSSHLLSLGEYFAMYLFVWSETLWPDLEEPDPLFTPPDFPEIYPEHEAYEVSSDEKIEKKRKGERALLEKNYREGKLRELLQFRASIRKVRRGLANISTLMTFDDHEATDDWHLNRDWVEEVYQKPLGRRILMNGLIAFGVFQAWGNSPELFAPFDPDFDVPRGRTFLETVSSWVQAKLESGHASEKALAKMVNIPYEQEDIDKFIDDTRGGKLPVYPEAISWYFTYRHPKYEALFTDARSQRALPDKRFDPSEHLTTEAILEQIPLTAEEIEFSLLVSPCNLLTINYFRNWVAKNALFVYPFSKKEIGRHNIRANNPDMADSWIPQTKAFEHMVSRLANRGLVKDGKRRTRLVVLSGDVHFSAVMRMHYWGQKPFRIYADDPVKDKQANIPKAAPAEMVIAHLVASGFKNEVGIFEPMHYLGYEITDVLDKKERLPVSEVYLGYQKNEAVAGEKRKEIVLNTRWFPDFSTLHDARGAALDSISSARRQYSLPQSRLGVPNGSHPRGKYQYRPASK